MRTLLLSIVSMLALAPLAAAPVPKKPDGPTEAQITAAAEAFKEIGGRHCETKDPLTGRTRHDFVFTKRLDDEFADKFPAVPFAFGLEFDTLDLPDEAFKVAASTRNLTRLKLERVKGLTETGLEAVAKARDLTEFEMRGMKLAATGLDGLTLTRLTLDNTWANDDTLAAVAKMTTLKHLTLRFARVTDDGVKHLAGLTKLKELNFDYSGGVGNAGMTHLVGLEALTALSLEGTQVSDDGMVSVGKLTALKRLSLTKCKVSDAGLKNVAELNWLAELSLSDTRVTDAGMKHLTGLVQLGLVEVLGTAITDDGMKTVRDALPNCGFVK